MKQKNTFSVSGKSIADLTRLSPKEIQSFKRTELAKVVTRLASAANKRIKRLQKSGVSSSALQAVDGRFSVSGKNMAELKEEYKRVKSFLGAETSTVTGAKKVRANVIEGARKRGVEISEKDYDKFFRAYEELKKVDPSVQDKLMKYNVWGELTEQIKTGASMTDILIKMQENLGNIYEKRFSTDKDFSEFFEF